MVNGTLIETALETMSSPMAVPSGLRSGFASATILRNDDALFALSCASAGTNLLHMDFFGLEGELGGLEAGADGGAAEDDVGGDEEAALEGAEEVVVEEYRRCASSSRRCRAGSGREVHGALETCRARRVGADGRGTTRMRARKANIVVGVVYAMLAYVDGDG